MNIIKIKKLHKYYVNQINIPCCHDAMQKTINGLKKERKTSVQQVYLHGVAQGIDDVLHLLLKEG